MSEVWQSMCAVLGIFALERVVSICATRSEKGRAWICRCRSLRPDVISIARMPMGLVSVALASLGHWTLAILWFSVWMFMGLTCASISRKCGLGTDRGGWLSALSDKCLYFPLFIYFSWSDTLTTPLPAFWVASFLAADTAGQALRLVGRKKGVNYFGKAKTALSVILLLLIAVDRLHDIPTMSPKFVVLLTISCAILAFMSVFCKVVPDVWYANSLTLANLLCGLASIWSVQQGFLLRAFVLVFVGQFFDLFDGRMARKYGSTRHGPIFDDIADGTSFGFGIGFLIYGSLCLSIPRFLAALLALGYIVCIVFRLYRFLNSEAKFPPGVFQGMPAPAGAMLGGSAALLFAPSYPWVAVVLVIATTFLLVSSIPYRHFGQRIWPDLPRPMKLLVFILFLVFINVTLANRTHSLPFRLYCFVMSAIYGVFGVDWRGICGKGCTDEEMEDDSLSIEGGDEDESFGVEV
ncbi:MAG: CDP-alcohol phosphatidyltransferase family protein [Lentisphaeria bacterium]|nr:CDP-alcohol phosphatidyltransferase family protein [Lentisphaeria bacterium]